MHRIGSPRPFAILLSLAAAFGWATYYIFVLALTPGTTPVAILVYPFLFGGVAYAAWTVAEGHGAAFLRAWREPAAYLRTALLVGMQLSVLAATYLTGPVDASLLSLIGDVVATPLIVAFLLGVHTEHIRTPVFAIGLLLSLAGGTMAIVGGQSLSVVHDWGWLVVPVVPLTVALYFLLTAQANARAPASAVVAQSMLAAALMTAAISFAIPGGYPGLVVTAPVPLLLLLVTGVTSFFLAPALYFIALGKVGLVIPPMLMTGIPVFTLLLSAVVLGIGLPLLGVFGIPVAVVGALFTLRGESGDERTGSAGRSE